MPLELAAVALALAGALSGATGLALPLIAGPVFVQLYPPAQAVMLTGVCSLLGQVFSVVLLKREISYQVRWWMIIPGLFGVPLGTELLLRADAGVLHIGFGALLMIFSLCFLTRRPLICVRGGHRICDAIVGLCGGTCGGLFGVSAAVPACWFCLQALDRRDQRAIVQPFIIAMQSASLFLLWRHGVHHQIAAAQLIWSAPAVLAGVAVGTFLFRRITCRGYARAILLLTFASGTALVIHP
jgi:uncharacterized protein